jgi:hypothetical protein
MKKNVFLDIKFYDKNTYSIDCNYQDKDLDYFSLDQFILISYIIRQIVTIGINHPVSKNVINTLYNEFPYPDINEVVVATFDEKEGNSNELFEKVDPNSLHRITSSINLPIRSISCKLGYEVNNDRIYEIWFKQDNEGFGVLGYGINYFLPLTIYILINYFLERKPLFWDSTGEKWDDNTINAWRIIIRTCARISCRELSAGKINLLNSLNASSSIFQILHSKEIIFPDKY